MGNLVFQATLGGQVNVVGPNTASTYNINVPTVNGTLVTTGDTGTVTNTMLAGSIANNKLTNSSVTYGTTTVSLGGTSTTLDGINIGATTPGTGAFTTLSASGNVTYSGGTANGVLYLNGSKVATSGSALTFDGTLLTSNGFATGVASGGKYTLAYTSNASSRSWRIANDVNVYGDFSIQQSTTQTGSTFRDVYSSLNDGTQFWSVGGSEQMRLNSTGLGIGTSSPSQKLSLVGTSTFNSFGSGPQITMADTLGRTLAFVAPGSVVDAYVGTTTNHTLNFMTGGTGRATIDTSGNLGIGNSSPGSYNASARNLVVGANSGSNGMTLCAGSTGANYIMFSNGTTGQQLYQGQITYDHNSHYMAFNTFAAERMRIDSSGNLLVGATATGVTNVNSVNNEAASGRIIVNHLNGTASGSNYIVFGYNTSNIGSITQNGTTGVLYNLTSDYRLKNNPTALTGAKEFVMALQPKTWDWWDGSGKGVGFIAHEFMEVAKYSGNGEKDAVDENGNPVYQSIQPSSSEVMANLVALIQEQQNTIEQLKADVAALKGA